MSGGAAGAGPQKSKRGTFDLRFERAAKSLLSLGVRPNHFSYLQLPVFAGMVWAALNMEPWWFFGLSWAVIILDGGDGILARVGGLQTRFGAFLDATMDTLGIAIVLWAAAQFHPAWSWAYLALFGLNVVLYLQNGLVEEKVVSYVRGPVILGVAFPDVLVISVVGPLVIAVFLVLMRVPATMRPAPDASGRPPAP